MIWLVLLGGIIIGVFLGMFFCSATAVTLAESAIKVAQLKMEAEEHKE